MNIVILIAYAKNYHLTCMLGKFHALVVVCLLFFKINFFKRLSGTPSESNILDSDKELLYVWPDLGPNCLYRLSEDDRSLH